jgi:hypothetical protein
LLAVVLAWGASVAGTGWWFFHAGQDQVVAEQQRDERLAAKAADAARQAVGESLSRLKVVNTTIQNEVERHVIEKPVYRDAQCRHDADGLRFVNAALTGTPAAGPAGGGELPAADAADGPVVRRDDPQAGAGGQPVPRVPEGSPR